MTSVVACNHRLWDAQSQTASGMACHHRPWTANMVERRRAWHAIIAFGQHRRSDGIRRCMPSSPLASTHSQMTSGVGCHHHLWGAHKIERCQALHSIIAFGQHTQSNDVGRGMTSPPLDCTDNQQRRAWHDITAIVSHTVRGCRAWHNITALGQQTRLDYIRRGMTSLPLYNTHGRTTSGVACHHRLGAAHTIE